MPSASSPSSSGPDTVVATRRFLAHSPMAVFAAFAEPTRLARWWGPSGFTNTFSVCEFRPGGRWDFVMHGPDGGHYENASRFREVRAPSVAEPGVVVIEHVSPPRFVLTVGLAADGEGTLLTWTQVFEDAETAARVRPIAEPANEENLDRLADELASAIRNG